MKFSFLKFFLFLFVIVVFVNGGALVNYKKVKNYIYFIQDGEVVYVDKNYEVKLKKKPFTIVFPFQYDLKKDSFKYLAQINFSTKPYAYNAIKAGIPTQHIAAFFTLTSYEAENKNQNKTINLSDTSNLYLNVDLKQEFDSFNLLKEVNPKTNKKSLKNYLGYFEVEKMNNLPPEKWGKELYIIYTISGDSGYQVDDNFYKNAKAESKNKSWNDYYKYIESKGFSKSLSLVKKVIIPIKVTFY